MILWLWLSMTALNHLWHCESTVSRLWGLFAHLLRLHTRPSPGAPRRRPRCPGRRKADGGPGGALKNGKVEARAFQGLCVYIYIIYIILYLYYIILYIYRIMYIYISQLQANYYLHASSHLLDWNWLCIPFVATHRPFWNTPKDLEIRAMSDWKAWPETLVIQVAFITI